MDVLTVSTFGDQTFQALFASLFEVFFTPLVPMRAKTQRIFEGDNFLEQFLAFAQRKLRRVVSIRVQQVEKIVIDHDATPSRLFRITQLHASLQAREARDVSFEGHDFAIDDEIVNRLFCERFGQLRI